MRCALARSRGIAALIVLALVVVATIAVTPTAAYAESPLSVTTSGPERILVGERATYTITVANTGGAAVEEYNLSLRDELPRGLTYVPGSTSPAGAEPTVRTDGVDGHQTLVWRNVSDLPAGASTSLRFSVVAGAAQLPVADEFANVGEAYAHSDPREVPDFTAAGDVVGGSYTTSGFSAPASSQVAALDVEKQEPSAEHELLRGVHDHDTVYTLTVTNNGVDETTSVVLVDHLPAQLEMLGCGTVDNSAAVEYAGAPRLDDSTADLTTGCPTPTRVETVTDPAGHPAGVYTRVQWNLGTLAADEVRTVRYRAGIPQRANTAIFPDGTPTATGLGQVANLDNNTGAATRETASEPSLTNHARVTGTYQGPVASGGSASVADTDTWTVSAEDLALLTSVAPSGFQAGGIATYTLTLRTGEYADASDVVVTDLLPNGLCPLSSTTNFASDDDAGDCDPEPGTDPTGASYDSVVQNPDGGFTITFDPVATVGHSDTAQVTYQARMRPTYADSDPTVSGDSFDNSSALTGTTTARAAVDPPDPGDESVADASGASISSDAPTLVKRIQPDGEGYTCSTSESGYVTPDPDTDDVVFELGSRVCFEVRVDFSDVNTTKNAVLTDFLPEHLTYEAGSAQPIAGVNDVTASFDDTDLVWTLGDEQGGDRFVQPGGVLAYRLSGIVTALPGDSEPDVTGNLAKLRWTDTDGTISFLRDQVDFELTGPPTATLTKAAVRTSGATTGPLTDNDASRRVRGGEVVDYTVAVGNAGTVETIVGPDVWDLLPTGLTCADVTAVQDGGSCADGVVGGRSRVRWDLPDGVTIAPGGSLDLDYTVTFPDTVTATTSLVNEAGVASFATTNNRSQTLQHHPASNVDPSVTAGMVDAPAAEDTFTVRTPGTTITKTNVTAITDADQAPAATTGPVVVGEEVTWTITVAVPAHTSVYDAVVTDPVPTGITRLSGSTRHSLDGGTSWSAGTAAGFAFDGSTGQLTFPSTYTNGSATEHRFEVTVLTRASTLAGNTQGTARTNTASLNAKTRPGGTALSTQSATSRVTVVEPRPALTKVVDATGEVVAGQVLGYTLTARNLDTSSPGTRRPRLNDAVVVDCVPAELTVDAGSLVASQGSASTAATGSNGCAAGRTPVVWDVGDVAWTAGSTWPTLDYDATVSLSAAGGSTYTNSASLVGSSLDDGQNGSVNERVSSSTASRSVTVEGADFTKTTSTPTRTIGERASFAVTTTLPADVNFYDSAVVDQLPSGLDVASLRVDAAGCTYPDSSPCGVVVSDADALTPSGSLVGWGTGDLTSDPLPRTISVTYSALVRDVAANEAGDLLTNDASFGWNQTDELAGDPAVSTVFDSTTDDASATVRLLEPHLSVAKVVDDTAPAPGETFTYTVTVSNGTGANISTAHHVDVTDAVPAGVDVLPGSVSHGGTLSGDGRTLTWTDLGPLAKGAATALTYDARLSSPAPTTARVNTADVSGYQGLAAGGRSYDDVTADTATLTPALPEVVVDKTMLDGPPSYVGEETDWRLLVTSTGDSQAFGVDVEDVLPKGWTYVLGSARVSIDGAPATAVEPTVTGPVAGVQTLTWTDLADLPVGDTVTITVATVPQASVTGDPGVGSGVAQSGRATVTAEDAEGNQGPAGGGSYGGTDTATTRIDSADVRVTTTHSGSPVAGAPFSWQVTARNHGADAAVGPFVVTDTPPAQLTGVTASGTGWSCSSAAGTLTCQRTGTLASAASLPVITVTGTVPSGETAGTSLVNHATVAARTHDPTPANNEDDDAASVTTAADLSVVKDLSGPMVAGTSATYTVAVANQGPSVHRGTVTVTDTLPAGLTYVSHTGVGWTLARDGQELAFTRSDDRPVGALPVITVTVDVAADRTAAVANTAEVQGTTPDPEPDNDTDTDTTTPATSADLALAKTHVGDFVAGEQGVYELTVTNTGPSDAAGPVEVTDELPGSLSYDSVQSEDGWACSADADDVVTCSLADGLADGGSSTLRLTVDIDPDLSGDVQNSATVTSATDDPHLPDNTDADDTGVDTESDLSIDKSHDASEVVAGEQVTYELAVGNEGPSGSPGPIEVDDTLPAGLSFVSASGAGWDCSGSGTTLGCTRTAALAAGADAPVVEVVADVAPDAGPATLTNVASVSGPAPDPVPANDTDADPTTVVDRTELSLTKTTTGDDPVDAGDLAQFRIEVDNDGSSDADDVVVTDVLPAAMTLHSVSGTGWTCDEETVSCSRATVAADTPTPALTVLARVGSGVADGTTLVNQASVSTSTPGDDPADNDDDAAVGVTTHADLALTASHATGTAVAGRSTTYALDVRNEGPSDASGPVVVTDTLPDGLSFLSASAPWDCEAGPGRVVECTLHDDLLAHTDAPRLELTAQVDAAAAEGEVTNEATVSSQTDDPVLANNDDDVPVDLTQQADLSVTKTHVGSPTVGQTFGYTLAVRNDGPSTAREVEVTDVLPAGLSLVSATGSGWTCAEDSGTLTCALDDPLASGVDAAPVELEVEVLPDAYPSVSNTAVVSAATTDPDPSDNSSTDEVEVPALADLSLDKRHVGPFAVGEPGVYRMTVRNDGPTPAEGPLTVTDALPAGLVPLAWDGDGWACIAVLGTVTCVHPEDLEPGEEAAVDLAAEVRAAAYPSVTNTATVASPSSDINPTDNTDDDVADVAPWARLDLVKEIASIDQEAEQVTWRLAVTNKGPTPTVVPLRVEDPLPAGLRLVRLEAPDWSCADDARRVGCVYAESLAVGEQVSLQLVTAVTAKPGRTVTNVARVLGGSSAPDVDGAAVEVVAGKGLQPGTEEAGEPGKDGLKPGSLSETGGPPWWVALAGLLMVAAGGALLVRRRDR